MDSISYTTAHRSLAKAMDQVGMSNRIVITHKISCEKILAGLVSVLFLLGSVCE